MGDHEVCFIITGHDRKEGFYLAEKELQKIFSTLGNRVGKTVWGEGVWQKGEVIGTPAMTDACETGKTV